jgi:hypothetical protein
MAIYQESRDRNGVLSREKSREQVYAERSEAVRV